MSNATLVHGQELRNIFRCCCLRSAPATIRSIAEDVVVQAKFAEIRGEEAVLTVRDTAVSVPAGPCCVVFCHGRASYLVTTVVQQDSSSGRLVVVVPRQMTIERRASVRVPADSQLRLTVTLSDGTALRATPIDVSLSGVSVEFDPDVTPELSVNDYVLLEMEMGDVTAALDGSMRRQTDRRFGVTVADDELDSAFDPPSALQQVYAALRQRTLAEQLLKPGSYAVGESVLVKVPASGESS